MKGRLLPEAYPHAMLTLKVVLDDVSLWHAGCVQGDVELLRQAQAAMRGTYILAKEKLQYLDDLPYLLARLHQPWGQGPMSPPM